MFAALTLPASGKSYAVLAFISAGYAVIAVIYARITAGKVPDRISGPEGAVS
jgi:hypothetical protein